MFEASNSVLSGQEQLLGVSNEAVSVVMSQSSSSAAGCSGVLMCVDALTLAIEKYIETLKICVSSGEQIIDDGLGFHYSVVG